ncbi:SDR family NAD(P)-dependent oxidoreductase [Celerinatantimonas sp. YJH-8]|uniref:SDR family NAD(P)-dependent oxidoreductase n=1 Tax=Celerinatantimonas sp. YJH-8 TaxID=3228714 RepID=UPI0038C61852
MSEFKDKVVLITGGAAGLGKCLAENFAKEDAKIVLVDINHDKLEETKAALNLGDRCITVSADVSKESEIIKYVEKAKQHFGKIDIFCNNAGIVINQQIKETDEASLDKIWGINMKGFYLGMKHVILAMEENGGGAIVNTGSVDSYSAAIGNALYTSSKYAVLAMTRCAALEEADKGIRVNLVCPGPINTDLMRDFEKRKNPDNPQAIIDSFSSQIPLGRYAEPQDVVNAILFLASEKASYITGTKIVVDGGWTHE